MIQFKRRLVGRHPCVSALNVYAWLIVGETPSGQKNRRFLSPLYIKQIKNIMKYQLYANASNKIR